MTEDTMTEEMTPAEPAKKKRKKGSTPTARTLAECRKRGWDAQVVERRIPKMWVTVDLFGCIDIIAIAGDQILAIQATGGDGGAHAARVAKILAEPRARRWLAAGGRLEVWSWAMRGAAKTRKLWTLRTEVITLESFVANDAAREQALAMGERLEDGDGA